MKDPKATGIEICKKIPRYSKLMLRLYRDPRISKSSKVLLTGGIAYALSPIDFIPGFFPVAGQLDDLIAMLAALKKTLHTIDKSIAEEHLTAVDLTMNEVTDDLDKAKIILGIILRETGKAAIKGITKAGKSVFAMLNKKK